MQNPSHTYNTAGTYDVTLTLNGVYSKTMSNYITVNNNYYGQGGVLWADNFANPSNWVFENSCSYTSYNIVGGYDFVNENSNVSASGCYGPSNSNNSPSWSVVTDPNLIPVSAMSPFNSTTVNDGYLFFSSNATGGGDNDGTPHYVRATNTTPIDLTGFQVVVLSFENNYRWWQDTRGVRVSGDNGATWYQYELTNNSGFQTGFQNNQSSGNPELTEIIFLRSQETSRKC